MRLDEMLEFTAEQYLDDRTDLLDGDSDNLWSDAVLVRLFNRAQNLMARRAWCIIEYGVAPAGVLVLATGKILYPLHKSVLRVMDATPSTQTAFIGLASDSAMRSPSPTGADAFDLGVAASLNGTDTYTGSPLAFAPDAATRTIRVYPTPAAAQAGVRVDLKVARLPITYLSLDDMEGEPEVAEEYHEDLCLYAAGKCLTMPNVDSAQKSEGRALLDDFDAAVREARRDRQRASHNGDRWAFSSTTAVIR